MLGLEYMKGVPTTYVIHHAKGKIKREGAGLSFLYFAPTSTVSVVPLASRDVPFVFNEVSADFQTITVQGQVTYRVVDARRLAELLDFSVDPAGAYRSDDPDRLNDRLVHAMHVFASESIQKMELRDALVSSQPLAAQVLARLRGSDEVSMLGVEVLGLAVVSIRPTPETARALEADAREALLRRADEAVYTRRNAAVEQERMIRESELNTEIAVEEKQRQIRETQMAAEIAVEQQRATLIDIRVENERKDADSRAYALDATLTPLKDVDWRMLMAVGAGGADPKLMIALAFRELAENAQKIGELNVTPDLLRSLLSGK